MGKLKIEKTFKETAETIALCCKEATSQLGWKVLDQQQNSITCKESVTLTSIKQPTKIEILWSDVGKET